MKIVKIISPAIATLANASLFLAAPTFAASESCNNPNVSNAVKASLGCGGEVQDLRDVISNILNSIVLSLGLVAVIFIIIGGINYMTSAGDTAKLEKAKKTILYACIGLIICALAFAIINFTISIIRKA